MPYPCRCHSNKRAPKALSRMRLRNTMLSGGHCLYDLTTGTSRPGIPIQCGVMACPVMGSLKANATSEPALPCEALQNSGWWMELKAPERPAFKNHTRSPHPEAMSETRWATPRRSARSPQSAATWAGSGHRARKTMRSMSSQRAGPKAPPSDATESLATWTREQTALAPCQGSGVGTSPLCSQSRVALRKALRDRAPMSFRVSRETWRHRTPHAAFAGADREPRADHEHGVFHRRHAAGRHG